MFGSALAEMPQGIHVDMHLLCDPRRTRGFNELKYTHCTQTDPTCSKQLINSGSPSKTIKALYYLQDYIQIPSMACTKIHNLAAVYLFQLFSPYLALQTPCLCYLSQNCA